ncbi:HEPN domain-containing protein [Echinicola sp. CAU 1574]|uniref:HEPN domain-containing protein n=1 Tax=Echinicola arenosa TaxID=2774144 RepID=A0ABR9AFW1_9BACT|nr:HEPN domain-containing protein [Echinicola arenosa]MBD8487116.1 HEPN domain-containing protein [Echinicola arenosa]
MDFDVVSPKDFYSQFEKGFIEEHLWEMYKGWVMYAEEVKGGGGLLDGVFFYQQLNGLLRGLDPSSHSQICLKQPPSKIGEKEDCLDALVTALSVLVQPEMIYLIDRTGGKGTLSTQEIYVVLSSTDYRTFEHLKECMDFFVLGRQEFSIHLTTKKALWSAKEAGDLFFLMYFQEFHLLFQDKGSHSFPEVDPAVLKIRKAKAKEQFRLSLQRAKSFEQMARNAKGAGDGNMELFCWHQSAELLLRGVILAWQNRERRSHEIRVLLNDAYKFIPGLKRIFPQNSDEENAVIKFLDDAYCKARYDEGFVLMEEKLGLVRSRVMEMIDLCENEMERVLKD